MKKNKTPAGGSAGAGGYSFQALVGARIAARLLAEADVGSLFALPAGERAEFLRFETEQPVDDILVQTTNSGRVVLQVTTNLSVSTQPNSKFYSVFQQFTRQWIASQQFASDPPLRISRLILAVPDDAPRSTIANITRALEAIVS